MVFVVGQGFLPRGARDPPAVRVEQGPSVEECPRSISRDERETSFEYFGAGVGYLEHGLDPEDVGFVLGEGRHARRESYIGVEQPLGYSSTTSKKDSRDGEVIVF